MTHDDDELPYDEAEGVLSALFPGGPVGDDVVAELRADGWSGDAAAEPLARAIGDSLWCVFSDNHRVIAPDGRPVSLGSWRASGGAIADFLVARVPGCSFDYMDFYMAGSFRAGDTSALPTLRLVFRRLRERGYDWRYSFPRIYVFSIEPPEPVDDPSDPDWKGYSPEEALRRESEERQEREESERLRETLDRGHREAVERARSAPPPLVVAAYRSIFGHDPQGWPP